MHAYTHTGVLLYQYREPGDSDGQLDYPEDICLDPNNILYMATRLLIVILNKDGHLVTYIHIGGDPYRIDVFNNIYCAWCYNDSCIYIYKLDLI